MSLQIFTDKVPLEILTDLFEKLQCKKQDNCYIFDKISYNRGKITNIIPSFLESCKKYYFSSKVHYIERKMTYNRFTTVLRQICNANKIPYSTQITYTNNSDYMIVYKFDIQPNMNTDNIFTKTT
jgi:hypothetical protein